jgi:hypothetical protein
MTGRDWRGELAAARRPVSPAQQAWDAHWDRVNVQGLAAGMSPGRAALRAMNVTEARHGVRPEETQPDKETQK